jgi:glycosyltransferase involved in cell wall biosynthesis/peptidoglycan/xylan/chitin deacetylase (PgdA/CDA1 family)
VLSLIKGLGPGGGEQLLVNLATAADRETFDHTVAYLLPWKDALVGQLEAAGIPTVCIDVGRTPGLAWARKLRALFARGDFDVVHVHSPMVAVFTRLVLRTMPRSQRPAVVVTEHNVAGAFGFATRMLDWATAPLDDARFAVSEEVRRSLPRHLQRTTETLFLGVPIDALRERLGERSRVRRALDVGANEVLVLTVANYRSQKGYRTLFDAVARVVRTPSRARFVAVGQGPLETEVHEWRDKAGLRDSFSLLGYRSDVPDLLAAADLLVVASSAEGLPVAVMEALAMGVPIVATAVGGIPELVRDGQEGLLVPSGDAAALAAAIARVVDDDELRARLGAAAFARADVVDIRRGAARHENVYRCLAAAPRSSNAAPRRLALRATKTLASMADRGRRAGPAIVILTYHRVGGRADIEVDLPLRAFEAQMAFLAEHTSVLDLDDALDRLADARVASKPQIVITFDDGTADFVDQALPVLERFRLPATLYVATEFVDTGRPFPNDGAPVSWAALRDARSTGLVEVGSHTHSHRLLDRIDRIEVEEELDRSIELIGSELASPPRHFAYPKGVLGSETAQQCVRARFRSAALAGTRPNLPRATDAFRLARSPIQVSDGMRWFEQKVHGGMWLEDSLRRASNRWRYVDAEA